MLDLFGEKNQRGSRVLFNDTTIHFMLCQDQQRPAFKEAHIWIWLWYWCYLLSLFYFLSPKRKCIPVLLTSDGISHLKNVSLVWSKCFVFNPYCIQAQFYAILWYSKLRFGAVCRNTFHRLFDAAHKFHHMFIASAANPLHFSVRDFWEILLVLLQHFTYLLSIL